MADIEEDEFRRPSQLREQLHKGMSFTPQKKPHSPAVARRRALSGVDAVRATDESSTQADDKPVDTFVAPSTIQSRPSLYARRRGVPGSYDSGIGEDTLNAGHSNLQLNIAPSSTTPTLSATSSSSVVPPVEEVVEASIDDDWFGTADNQILILDEKIALETKRASLRSSVSMESCTSPTSTTGMVYTPPTSTVESTAVDYNGDTWRRAADANRAASRRLFAAMQQQPRSSMRMTSSSTMRSTSTSSVSGSTVTNVGNVGGTRRLDVPPPSYSSVFAQQHKYGGSQPIYANVSSSSIEREPEEMGVQQQSPTGGISHTLPAATTHHHERQTSAAVLPRSRSTDTFARSASFNSGATAVRNQRLAQQTSPANLRGQFVSPTAIEHGAKRGVKKIIYKRRDEQKQTFQMRGLPDPPLPPSPVAATFKSSSTSTTVNNANYMQRPFCEFNELSSEPGIRLIAPPPPYPVDEVAHEHHAMTDDIHSILPSSERPSAFGDWYSERHSSHAHFQLVNKMMAPPLPQQPPPPLSPHEQRQLRAAAVANGGEHQQRQSSAVIVIGDGGEVNAARRFTASAVIELTGNSTHHNVVNEDCVPYTPPTHLEHQRVLEDPTAVIVADDDMPRMNIVWPPVKLDHDDEEDTTPHRVNGKPTVQVHPMVPHIPTLVTQPPVDKPTNENRRQPPPAVARKPQLGAHNIQRLHINAPSSTDEKACAMTTTSPSNSSSNDSSTSSSSDCIRMRDTQRARLSEEEAKCERLSQLIGTNDEQLSSILAQRPSRHSTDRILAATRADGGWLQLDAIAPPTPSVERQRSMTAEVHASIVPSTTAVTFGAAHERSASSSSSSAMSQSCTDADIRVLANLYGRKTSCVSLLSTGQTPGSSRPTSPLVKSTKSSPKNTIELDDERVLIDERKKELIGSLTRKIGILSEELQSIADEQTANDRVGDDVRRVWGESGADHADVQRLNKHVSEADQVTRLILKLTSQLSRIEAAANALAHGNTDKSSTTPAVDTFDEERKLLGKRRVRVSRQLDDATTLQQSVCRRGDALVKLMQSMVDPDTLTDYTYFVHMKQKLLVDAHEINEKLMLGDDQLHALHDSIRAM